MERFFAKDMKSALEQVKDKLGADAIIISNKKVSGGVEIVATLDEPTSTKTKQTQFDTPIKSNLFPPSVVNSLDELLSRQKNKSQAPKKIAERQAHESRPLMKKPTTTNKANKESTDATQHLAKELTTIRRLLTHQMAHLMWQEVERNSPIKAYMIQQLKLCGFPDNVTDALTQMIPEDSDEQKAWKIIENYLHQQLYTGEDEITQEGGIIILLGPTGVGKTTTISKLAARFAMHFGKDQVALISCDNYRIGAYEQLHTFGKIIGCAVKKVDYANQIPEALAHLDEKRLVLIDTAGMGQRDQRLQQQLHDLVTEIDYPCANYLTLPTTSHTDVLRDTVDYFQRVPLTGVILTKLDESLSIGGALGVCLEKDLRISYTTNGQRVPEDLDVANKQALIQRAFQTALQDTKSPYFWQDHTQCLSNQSMLSEE